MNLSSSRFLYGIVGVFIFSGCSFFDLSLKTPQEHSSKYSELDIQKQDSCDVSSIKKRVSGTSMEPMIRNGDTVLFFPEYYNECDTRPKKGDLVVYDFFGRNTPLIKKVIATEFDHIEIIRGRLIINGKEVKNSGGVSYIFSSAEIHMLTKALEDDNVLPEKSLVLLGDNVSNSQDSRTFGIVNERDVRGKFDFLKTP